MRQPELILRYSSTQFRCVPAQNNQHLTYDENTLRLIECSTNNKNVIDLLYSISGRYRIFLIYSSFRPTIIKRCEARKKTVSGEQYLCRRIASERILNKMLMMWNIMKRSEWTFNPFIGPIPFRHQLWIVLKLTLLLFLNIKGIIVTETRPNTPIWDQY